MKILAIHADHITWESKKKAIKSAEEDEQGKQTIKDCLVIFTAVEKADETNIEAISEKLKEEIEDIAKQVKAETIVLYPYAHLSNDLASAEKAIAILKQTELLLKKDKKVYRAPFGWYKSFEISNKGHPLSELSRSFTLTEETDKKTQEVSEAVKKEEKLVSHWHIIDVDGELHTLDIHDGKLKGYNFGKNKNLETFSSYEMAKVRKVNQEPAHVTLMKKLELVDYEEGSDPGNLRYYPKGRLIKGLLETHVNNKVSAYGGMEIESPIMYDFEHPSLKSYLNRFPARQYTIQTPNKKVFLRFAACFGQFLMAHDATISYKNLPLRLYEMTRYSFRVEQRGELTGLRRLRAFTMPDCHALCENIEQAKQELMKRFELVKETQTSIGFDLDHDFELGIRVTKDFYEKNKSLVHNLVKSWGKPALLEMWDQKFFYFVFKYELNFVDANNKATALSTDQIDVENGERYNITFTDKEGIKKHPIILHCSPPGAIERVMYALLEKANLMSLKGKTAVLPLWLNPTQVRVIPVSADQKGHMDASEKLQQDLTKHQIRVDLDDNNESIGKRIRHAEQEWVPYIVVIGDKEAQSKNLNVRIRETGKQQEMTKQELIELIQEQTKDRPYKSLPLPIHLSQRPIFVG